MPKNALTDAEREAGRLLGLAEHEMHLRRLWRDLADSGIEDGVDWPGIVRTLARDIDRLATSVTAK